MGHKARLPGRPTRALHYLRNKDSPAVNSFDTHIAAHEADASALHTLAYMPVVAEQPQSAASVGSPSDGGPGATGYIALTMSHPLMSSLLCHVHHGPGQAY